MSFARRIFQRPPRTPLGRLTRPSKPWTQGPIEPIEKEGALQHEGYMDVVRRFACAHCGKVGPSQFCHADEGKGERIKTDCRRGWPGCADQPGRMGCHTLIGSTGRFTQEQRRALEAGYGAKTRAKVDQLGLWPASLPRWQE